MLHDQNDFHSLLRIKSQQEQGEQEFGDYEVVLQFAEGVILQHHKNVISIKNLHEIYKLHPDDTRYRHKFKLQLSLPAKQLLSWLVLRFPVIPLNNRHISSARHASDTPSSSIKVTVSAHFKWAQGEKISPFSYNLFVTNFLPDKDTTETN